MSTDQRTEQFQATARRLQEHLRAAAADVDAIDAAMRALPRGRVDADAKLLLEDLAGRKDTLLRGMEALGRWTATDAAGTR